MKKSLLFVLFVFIIIIAFLFSLIQGTGAPDKFVGDFYKRLLSDEDGYLGNGEFESFDEITPAFKSRAKNLISGFDKGGFDPFFCAQDRPVQVETNIVTKTSSTSKVAINGDFGETYETSYANLVRRSGEWMIDSIDCHSGDVTEQNQVGDYIKDNIGSLSPVKESLGGKFFVTSISFNGQGGIINYEDGHNAYSAYFKYEISGSGKVNISDVKFVEDDPIQGTTFNKAGNLKRSDKTGNWILVYEEAGKPALTKELMITEDSICSQGQDTIYCSASTFAVGDRVQVEGKENDDRIQVLRMIKKQP